MLTSVIKVRVRESDKTEMAVIRRDALADMCAPHLDRGEEVRECVEATVIEVSSHSDTTIGIDRVIVALTGHRLLTLAWPGGAPPALDGAVPIGFLAGARVDDAAVGVVLTVSLTTGVGVRFGVGSAQEAEARELARALAFEAGGPVTEELPVVARSATPEARGRRQLAEEIAALCERNRGRILELTPGLFVSSAGSGESTYYVHVAPPARAEGGCPRCDHVNRDGAVFCDACGTLL